MGTAAGIGLFLLGLLVGGIVGWVLGVTVTHAKFGVPLDDEQPIATLPPTIDLPVPGPTPKAER